MKTTFILVYVLRTPTEDFDHPFKDTDHYEVFCSLDDPGQDPYEWQNTDYPKSEQSMKAKAQRFTLGTLPRS